MAEPTVLVLGATGNTGSAVLRMVRAEGARALAATRRPETAAAAGVADAVRFDWHDPAGHAAALRGVDRLYLVAPLGVAEPLPVVEPFLKAAVAQGVRRAVLLSSSAVDEADTGLGALHTLVRRTVPEWAVLRPSWFMQNFTGDHPVAQAIRGDGEIVSATGDGRVAFVDATDIAAVATRALLDDRPHDTEHVITGPEALGYAEAARVVAEVSGRPVRHTAVATGELTERLRATGLPPEFAAFLAGLDEDIRHGAEDRTTDTVERVTGRPPRSFRAFAEAHRAAFAPPSAA
ncbi:NmrA family NAD(P)-binding protein [Streptomyces sp. DASNCL29]|uniref:NmrA family NAD(P)-binding protein n=1 Tax=Streptomyces sp. DASNCL29 TaxID=2583819 RepID=UPI00110FAF82|nr:NmrA family NAD(P)-binding protein [Streptomyces sp. DASNCL29]TMU89589.1 ergot alkaloid biosynthesis protein [Streptomyces sp. DASNCL29]